MEFKANLDSTTPPKNLYPCLATITLGPQTDKGSRRQSGSAVSDDEGGLKRVISGGRRKTSFGQVADRGDLRDSARKSMDSGAAGFGGVGGQAERGTWYWRVQAGVNDTHLVLLPLSQPANPLLTSAPAPLSEVMPSHSTAHTSGNHGNAHAAEHESLGTKMKNLFTGGRKNSKDANDHHDPTAAAPGTSTGTGPGGEKILDQTGSGEQVPTPSANAVGATNLNANAETGWPGFVGGDKLGAIVVNISAIDQSAVKLHEHKKESSFVTVPITAHLAGVGQSNELAPKSGFIKFEFDKNWIGAKGEAELLHHYITTAVQNNQGGSQFVNQNFQLGGGANTNTNSRVGGDALGGEGAGGVGVGGGGVRDGSGLGGSPRAGQTPLAPPVVEIAPDQSVSTASSGKVAGTY